MGLSYNNLSGQLPDEIGNFVNLDYLYLYYNKFSGQLPEKMVNIWDKLKGIGLYRNELSGRIPDAMTNHPKWNDFWTEIVMQNGAGFDLSGIIFPGPVFDAIDLDGNALNSEVEYAKNKLTIIYEWATWCPYSRAFNKTLLSLYEAYKNKGVEVIGYNSCICPYTQPCDELEEFKEYITTNNITWRNFGRDETHNMNIPSDGIPYVAVIDQNGHYVFGPLGQNRDDLADFLKKELGEADYDYYTSTDYSRDGEVITLQKASVGKGIDLVFMGEAFVDRDMESGGKYEQKMKEAMEQFFSFEPYKTFRNRFNVYTVKVISPNEEFTGNAIHRINEKDELCFEYAQKVPNIRTDRLQISVIYNTEGPVGRSYTRMHPSDGSFVGYMMDGISNVLNHESGGHGFPKLWDEYIEPGNENLTLPNESKEEMESYWINKGWGANVDWRNNRATVRWAHFLNDSRYANEGLGLYEGAYLYGYGAYRPTENSMMRYNDSPFNAPSREQIYKTIMQLSEGANWTYDYEKFVEYDAINRNATTTRALNTQPSEAARKEWQKYHRPPVVVEGTWRDAIKQQQQTTIVPLR